MLICDSILRRRARAVAGVTGPVPGVRSAGRRVGAQGRARGRFGIGRVPRRTVDRAGGGLCVVIGADSLRTSLNVENAHGLRRRPVAVRRRERARGDAFAPEHQRCGTRCSPLAQSLPASTTRGWRSRFHSGRRGLFLRRSRHRLVTGWAASPEPARGFRDDGDADFAAPVQRGW